MIPTDGTRDFPIDGVSRVFLEGGYPNVLRDAMVSEHRLRSSSGAVAPVDVAAVRTRLDLFRCMNDLVTRSAGAIGRSCGLLSVKRVNVEAPGKLEVSDADTMLGQLG